MIVTKSECWATLPLRICSARTSNLSGFLGRSLGTICEHRDASQEPRIPRFYLLEILVNCETSNEDLQ